MNERNLNEGQWSLVVAQRRKMFWNWYIHTYLTGNTGRISIVASFAAFDWTSR